MSSPMGGLPQPPMFQENNFARAWASWFSNAHQVLSDVSNSGTTAQRPSTFMYVGKPYFDTTIGMPINVKSLNPTVWVNGVGTAV
jgi:hypothetical protein